MKLIRASIVPNATSSDLLRVYTVDIERLPIVAWRIEEYDNPYQVWTFPISIEEASANCVEFIVVPNGACYLPNETRLDTEEGAIAYARKAYAEKLK